jgi:protoporphyrinogen IX oxidase
MKARLAHELAAPGVAAQATRAARGVGRRRRHGAILGTASRRGLGAFGATPIIDAMGSSFLWVKALHIVFVSSWFAGLFYLPRLFVNLASVPADSHAERERLLMMARKLYRFSGLLMVIAIALGLVLWLGYGVGKGPGNYWLHAKIALVVVAIGYHHACRSLLRKFEEFANTRSERWFRVFNESAVLLFTAIVILVVVKPFS